MVVLTSPVKCILPTLKVCPLWLVALFQKGYHHLTLSPLFVSYWDMLKCIFLHRFLLLYSLSCEQASREQVSLILVAVEVGPPVVSGVLQLVLFWVNSKICRKTDFINLLTYVLCFSARIFGTDARLLRKVEVLRILHGGAR